MAYISSPIRRDQNSLTFPCIMNPVAFVPFSSFVELLAKPISKSLFPLAYVQVSIIKAASTLAMSQAILPLPSILVCPFAFFDCAGVLALPVRLVWMNKHISSILVSVVVVNDCLFNGLVVIRSIVRSTHQRETLFLNNIIKDYLILGKLNLTTFFLGPTSFPYYSNFFLWLLISSSALTYSCSNMLLSKLISCLNF